jgi:EVE domain
MTRYWLMKCEPDAYSIDDLKRDRRTSSEGVAVTVGSAGRRPHELRSSPRSARLYFSM